MHVTFVSLGSELIGVEYLSAYLKKYGHSTSLAHHPALFNDRFQLNMPLLAKLFDQDDRIVEYILHLDPDLIGFSCLTNTFEWSLEIARRVREQKRIPTIFGGVHPSAIPEFVLGYDEVDFVCESEGEVALLELCNDLECGGDGTGINNIWAKPDGEITRPPMVSSFLQDLDSLPFPDKELYAGATPSRSVYRTMTARGCPYRCTFCFNNFFANLPDQGIEKDYVRRRSVDNVMEELHQGKERFDFRQLEFHDDIFTMHKDWLREFLPRLKKEINVPFYCETHAKFMDEEVAQLLKDGGCAGTKMGIQSLGEFSYKHTMLKRAEKEEDLIRALDACRKVGVQLDADHIFGLPEETQQHRDHALKFYREHTPGRIACFWLTYFPGIEITTKAHEAGQITDEQLNDIHRGKLLWYHQIQAMTAEGRKNLKENSGYMIAFHLMPVVPKFLRRFVVPNVIRRIPLMGTMSRGVMALKMLKDFVFGGSFDAWVYLRGYLFFIFGRGRHLNKVPRSSRDDESPPPAPDPVPVPVAQQSV